MLSKITAIIILYDVSDKIFECLKNLKSINLVVINNGKSHREIINKIKSLKNLSKYIESKKNLGFGRAATLALKYVKTEYSLLIGADVLISEDSILRLIEKANLYKDAAVIVPTLLNEKNQNDDFLENLPELGKSVIRSNLEEHINSNLEKKKN